MNASAAKQSGDSLTMLKKRGTLGTALRSIRLHGNPLTLGNQDAVGRDGNSSNSSAEVSSVEAEVSTWERSIDGLHALLKFVKGEAPLDMQDLNEDAILQSLNEGRWALTDY
jgi:hypothetical protein